MSRYYVFATVALALLLNAISMTAPSVAFPLITSSFDSSLVLSAWVLSVYQLAATAAMPLAGKAGDMLGRKPTIMASLALFTAGSLFCAIAPNIYLLILSRFIQAVGGGSFLPLAAGAVADEFPRSTQRAIGLFTSIGPLGSIIAPNLGGWMAQSFGWRSLFWLNVPLGVILLAAAARLLKTTPRQRDNIDLAGAALFTGSVFAFMAGLGAAGNTEEPAAKVLSGLLLGAGIVLIITFLRHERNTKDPVIDLEVLTKRPFLAANIYNFAFGACILGIMSLVPLYGVSLYGMSTLQSGFVLTPRSAAIMAVSIVSSMFLTRWGYRRPILIGTGMMVLSLFLLGLEPSGQILGMQMSSVTLLMLIMALSGVGMGLAAPASNNACIELMPHRIATITGVRGMFRQTGGAIGIAISSLLLESLDSMALGFTVVFIGLAVFFLMTIPFVFAMPGGPRMQPPGGSSR